MTLKDGEHDQPGVSAHQGRRYTMADIARKAGVSTATVSRALTRPDRVNAVTRELVEQIAREAGFRPNLIGRQLRNQTADSLLILVQDLANPFYTGLIKGAEGVALEKQYSIMVGNTDQNLKVEQRYSDLFLGNRVDGLILVLGHLPHGLSPAIAQGSPIVLVSELNARLDLPHVGIDNVHWAAEAVRYLIGRGHRRIGHVSGPMKRSISHERRGGYLRAMAEAGLEVAPSLIVEADFSIDGGRRAAGALLSQPERPTAIFCANDESAIGVILEARAHGLSVPDDLSVVGFDDIYLAEISDPPLTTIRQPREEMGRASAGLVIEMIETGKALVPDIQLDCALIERGSVATLG